MSETPAPQSNQDYCAAQLRARDEERWFALQYARARDKRALIALYAFAAEVRRIPSSVSEPPLGEIRLQWWRDALGEITRADEPRAHPLVAEIAANWIQLAPIRDAMVEILDGTARALYVPQFSDADDLAGFVAKAQVPIDMAAWRILAGDDAAVAQVKRAAEIYAMAKMLPRLNAPVFDEVFDRCAQGQSVAANSIKHANEHTAPIVLPFLCVGGYLRLARGQASPLSRLRKRLRMFVGMAFGR